MKFPPSICILAREEGRIPAKRGRGKKEEGEGEATRESLEAATDDELRPKKKGIAGQWLGQWLGQ